MILFPILNPKSYILNSRSGVTLLELLIFIGVFSIAVVGFIGVLVTITRIQVRQVGAAEVNQQSQFLLQTVQYYVERSSAVEIAADITTSTLKLRMASSTGDPAYIKLQNGVVYFKETDAGVDQPLTSNKVTITNLSFTRHTNPPGHDSVSISFTMEYATSNATQRFVQSLNTAISRVSAATFDSNIQPSTAGILKLGASAGDWQSINSTIYFSGSNVGIGPTLSNPQQRLEIDGGIRLNTSASKPSCNDSIRGTLWVVQNGGGKDDMQVCIHNASGTVAWVVIY